MERRSVFYDKEASVSREKPLVVRTKYEMKLSLDVGPKAKNVVSSQAVVRELEKYCRNSIQC